MCNTPLPLELCDLIYREAWMHCIIMQGLLFSGPQLDDVH